MEYKLYDINPDADTIWERLGLHEEYLTKIIDSDYVRKALSICVGKRLGVKGLVDMISKILPDDSQLRIYFCIWITKEVLCSENTLEKMGFLPYIGEVNVSPDVLLYLYDYTLSYNSNRVVIFDILYTTVKKFKPSTSDEMLTLVFFTMLYVYYDDSLETFREKKI